MTYTTKHNNYLLTHTTVYGIIIAPIHSKFSPLSTKRRPFLMIFPVQGAIASASDVGVMSGIHDIGT